MNAFVDPRDVGTAAAAILSLPTADLKPFLDKKNIEVHGPANVNFADVATALSRVAGYEITVQQVPRDAWVKVLLGFGLPRVFATSFLETVEQMDGVIPLGYESYGAPAEAPPTSPELLALGWKPKSLEEWAESVKGAFIRA